MFDALITGIDKGMRAVSEAFGGPVSSYCRLETVDREAIVADDGSLISVCRLEGCLKHVGVDEYRNIILGLSEKLHSSLSKPGHLIQVVFDYNPDSAEHIRSLLEPSKTTTQNLGLDLTELFDNWGEALRRFCCVETCWIVLWTRQSVLPDSLRKTALKERDAGMTTPTIYGCQQVSRAISALHDAHDGFVAGVVDAFREVDLIVYRMDPHNALHDIRFCIDPEVTGPNWRALLPGDPLPLRLPDPEASKQDQLQHIIYPDFQTQLFPREGETISRSAIRIGDCIYGPAMMTLCPQTPKPFQELFRILSRRDERMPYRMAFLIEPGGLNLGLRPLLATLLSFSSSSNKKFNRAVDALVEADLQGHCITKLRICFCTWARIRESQDAAHQLLRRRMAELSKVIQGWGTCDVSEAIGDPLLGVMATVPGMMPSSPSPITATPLQEAISMLPFRPASPWKGGSLILRTPDGKLMPFAPNSSEQASWIDIGVAPMGAGKSVFLNAINFAFVTQPGISRLPWLSIVDVGPSSSGLITLLRESLPRHMKHLAAYHRLRMTSDYAINPFDTPLGLRTPLPAHKAFLINLLSLLATPLDALAPADGVPGLLQRAIDLAYEDLSDTNHPRLYQSNAQPELHELILSQGIHIDAATTWWEIVDALFERGFIHEAISAQRYAVPLLADVSAQITQNQGIKNTYPEELRLNVWRAIIDAIEAYVILKEPTKFDLGDAQVVSLDLDEVAPRGGATADRQSAVMYMLARHILGARFFLMPADVALMPNKYKNYHAERIEAIREDPKRICYDEAHRVTKNASVAGQLQADMTTMSRESRKWNLSLGLYSQSIEDIPEIITELATTVLMLGAGTDKGVRELVQRFGLNGGCQYALGHLSKPGPAGANFIGLFKTAAGVSQLPLTLTIGGQSLWAFSSTTEDVTIRNGLYALMQPTDALRRLARRFPGGSAKSEVERRRRFVDQNENINVIKQLIGEIAEGEI